MHHGKTWLAAFALVGGCYVETPKNEVADAEAIREAAREDAGAAGEDAATDSATADADADAGVGDAGTADASGPTCACDANGDTPVCLADGTCVACTATSNSCNEAAPICDLATHTCVACETNAECTSADASKCADNACVRCESASDCTHIEGKNVCSEGTCVACTSTADGACALAGAPTACDPNTLTCTTRVKRGTATCHTCVSDSECEVGNVCVNVAAGGGSSVCLPVVPEQGRCPQPYVGGTATPVTTAENRSVQVCTLSVAGATCQAHLDYVARTPCGNDDESNPGQDVPGSGQSSKCGVAGLDDGFCAYSSQLKRYLCTVACKPASTAPQAIDCPRDTVSCSSMAYSGGTMPRTLCSF